MSRNVVLASLRHNFQITSQQLVDNALTIHFDLLAMDDTTTQLPHPRRHITQTFRQCSVSAHHHKRSFFVHWLMMLDGRLGFSGGVPGAFVSLRDSVIFT